MSCICVSVIWLNSNSTSKVRLTRNVSWCSQMKSQEIALVFILILEQMKMNRLNFKGKAHHHQFWFLRICQQEQRNNLVDWWNYYWCIQTVSCPNLRLVLSTWRGTKRPLKGSMANFASSPDCIILCDLFHSTMGRRLKCNEYRSMNALTHSDTFYEVS